MLLRTWEREAEGKINPFRVREVKVRNSRPVLPDTRRPSEARL